MFEWKSKQFEKENLRFYKQHLHNYIFYMFGDMYIVQYTNIVYTEHKRIKEELYLMPRSMHQAVKPRIE